ncbi:MAG TPA: DUF998 domain-containing protein, partial [Pseudonocardiaceae bacterium]|nr:DUF998 domain-containing protein [Pseudonocardiaceae bacterium]
PVRTVPWWSALSAASAPVLLIGGWQLAAARQPGGFDPVRQTISALAAHGATDRWIMTTGLAGVGVCHVVTAVGLRSAAPAGRVLLATGGAATVAVAAFSQPLNGDSSAHVTAAAVAFPALSLWPALAWRPGRSPSRTVSLVAASGLLALLGWFGLDYFTGSSRIGLSERVLAAAQSLWPLAAVATVLLRPRKPAADRGERGLDNGSLLPGRSPGGRKGR